MMAKAGPWEISHGGPYPIWCGLHYNGREALHGINHKELQDLYYTIGRAIKECRDKLPEHDKHEMD